METINKKGLNANSLKVIAIIAMTIDHLAWTIFPGYDTRWWILILHSIGRLTAPIMCYFVAEGYHYTHNIKKYALRLLAFAIISHFAYNFAFDIPMIPFSNGEVLDQTGVIWALFWGLIALTIADSKSKKLPQWLKVILLTLCCVISFCADWSCIATLVIVHFGLNRGRFKSQMIGMLILVAMYSIIYCIFIDFAYGLLQMMVVLAIPVLKFYNGERGKCKSIKWFFYVYYPVHLFICGFIRLVLH